MFAIVCREEQHPTDVRQFRGIRRGGISIAIATLNILDQDRALFGPVAFPQLRAMFPVVCGEEQNSIDVRQIRGIRCTIRPIDILYQDGAIGGSVALPQLDAVFPVLGGKESRTIDIDEHARRR